MLFSRRQIGAVLALALLMTTLLVGGCGEPVSATLPDAVTAGGHEPPLPPVGIWLDEDPYLRGYPALATAVAALSNNIRVLHTGAHPDDEQSDLVAYLARGRHFRTAYLSATRGEGGQNGIGPEKGAALGVIRTEELLAARRIDGAEQYFLSKADFGFSKTAEETLKNWGHDETLKELVHFIRWYRPHVIVSVFSGTPFDGHGHHQAIGQLTREAFDAAADPKFKDDLPPWRTQILYQSLWRDPGEDKLPGQRFIIDAGQYDPLLGKTYHQLAMQGRSQHRSQDMGAAQDPGPRQVVLRAWANHLPANLNAALENGNWSTDAFGPMLVFDWRQYELLGFPTRETLMEDTVYFACAEAARAFRTGDRENLLKYLQEGQAAARAVASADEKDIHRLGKSGLDSDPVYPHFGNLLVRQHELNEVARHFERALHLASGVQFDVRCDKHFLTHGESGTLTVRVIPQQETIARPTIAFDHADSWQITQTSCTGPDQPTREIAAPLPTFWTFTYTFTVPADAPYTQPAYKPMAWAETAPYGNHHQATMDLPPIIAHLTYSLDSTTNAAPPLKVSTSAQYVWTDPRFGERREMVKVVPPMVAEFASPILARTPTAGGAKPNALQPALRIKALVDHPPTAHLTVYAWPTQPSTPFNMVCKVPKFRLDRASAESVMQLPSSWQQNLDIYYAELEPVWNDDIPFNQTARPVTTLTRLDYPHIRPHNLFTPVRCKILPQETALPKDLKVGYIAGPGTDDEMIDALKQMGAAVTVLDEDGLAKANFNDFDTVFAGVRAYEVRPDLVAANAKLLDWVKAGGTLIVLYQKYPFAKLNCAPAKFQYSRPHDRVTEQDAPVEILQPDHALLTRPNQITAADFTSWHQDRGLYFFAEENRDPGYTALLSCHDTDEPPKSGGLLVYTHGQGHWVYCAYALHLQIPNAVPGAWRILANLASYSREPAK